MTPSSLLANQKQRTEGHVEAAPEILHVAGRGMGSSELLRVCSKNSDRGSVFHPHPGRQATSTLQPTSKVKPFSPTEIWSHLLGT
jgi:hypothetical protein